MNDILQWAMIVAAIASIPIYAIVRERYSSNAPSPEIEENSTQHVIHSRATKILIPTYPPYRGVFTNKSYVGLDTEYSAGEIDEERFGSVRRSAFGHTKYGEPPALVAGGETPHSKPHLPN
jgi:hypothetical protein